MCCRMLRTKRLTKCLAWFVIEGLVTSVTATYILYQSVHKQTCLIQNVGYMNNIQGRRSLNDRRIWVGRHFLRSSSPMPLQ